MDEVITNQGRAIAMMHGDTMKIIAHHAEEFRAIINDFRDKFGRVPSASDFIWLASEHANMDLTKGEVQ